MFFVVGAKNQQHHKVERGTHNKDCFKTLSQVKVDSNNMWMLACKGLSVT